MSDHERHEFQRAGIEAALEHGIDIFGRRIWLHGGIDEDTIGMAIRGLYMLGDIGSAPIELYVSSYGGYLDESFALHDVTRTIKCDVVTCALGKCMSAAPLLVACGKQGYRYTTESTTFMLHDTRISEMEGRPAELVVEADVAKGMMDHYAKLLARYTKKDKRHWRRLFDAKTDRYFDADTAIEWGVVDAIWNEKD